MLINSVHCGYLKVQAIEMIKSLGPDQVSTYYKLDQDGNIRLSMQAVLVEEAGRKVIIDPGAADFLPLRLRQKYGVEMPVSVEEGLRHLGLSPEQITDVVFTHLHCQRCIQKSPWEYNEALSKCALSSSEGALSICIGSGSL